MDATVLFLVIFPLGVLSQTLQESGPGIVKPSQELKITCTVSGFELSSYGVSWIRQRPGETLEWIGVVWGGGSIDYANSLKSRTTISKDNAKKELYLQMRAMEPIDSGTYYCAKLDVWGPGTTVTVTAAETSGPTVFPLLPCCGSSLSSEVTIGCLSTSFLPAPVDVSWNSGSITSGIRNLPAVLGGNGKYLSTSLLTVSASEWTTKTFTCNVSHKTTDTNISHKLKQECGFTGPSSIEVMQSSCGGNGSVSLVCLVSGYYPKDIDVQWLQKGKTGTISPSNRFLYNTGDGKFASSSNIIVSKEDWNSEYIYICKVAHSASSTTHEKHISKCLDSTVGPKVTLLPPSPKDILINEKPKLTCVVSRIHYTKSLNIVWDPIGEDNRTTEEEDSGTYTVKSTKYITINDWNDGKTFTCTVTHNELTSPAKKKIKKTPPEQREDPTVHIFAPRPEDMTGELVGVTCRFEGYSHQEMSVMWKKNNDTVDEADYSVTEPILSKDNKSFTSYSTLYIKKSEWNSGMSITCSGLLNKNISKNIKGSNNSNGKGACRGK
ncbi:immunoglobulin gamma-1 heavy chain-like isoform X3 [Hyperolius riggenbachi]|uniref:immunoglobulin gamma-1 heavy chain-like isoform X3 n=1 Tax=Hyperolius riggenbachi TaxID=752182 RepID=UPI0035A307E4